MVDAMIDQWMYCVTIHTLPLGSKTILKTLELLGILGLFRVVISMPCCAQEVVSHLKANCATLHAMRTTIIPTLMPGAEPHFYAGNDIGCLVLHGLTATPAEVSWLASFLAEHGLTVYAPRIAGHGTDPRHLLHTHWQHWYASALDGYHVLRDQCRQVFVVGHSMGGLLALLLAASEGVEGVVVLASPIKLGASRFMRYAHLIKYVQRFVDLPDHSDFPERLKAEQRQRGEPALGRVRYDRWAVQALAELRRLARTVDTHLPGVNAPCLLLYSEADDVVHLDNQAYIRGRLASTVIETDTFKNSGHIMTQDVEYQDVFKRVGLFIEQNSPLA